MLFFFHVTEIHTHNLPDRSPLFILTLCRRWRKIRLSPLKKNLSGFLFIFFFLNQSQSFLDGTKSRMQRLYPCKIALQTAEGEQNANPNSRTMADLSHQPTSCETDYLQTREFPLSLSHSNLLCAFTLKQSNLYFNKSFPGFCNWFPSD